MPEPTKLPVQSEKGNEIAASREWALFDRLRADVDHVLEQIGSGFPWRLPSRFLSEPAATWPPISTRLTPAVDIVEQPTAYEITAELPGLDEKDIELKLVNGMLVIKGEKQSHIEKTEGDYRMSERRFGAYERSFLVPEGVDPAKIEATFGKGVLKVMLPKTAEAQKETKVSVKAA